MNKTTELYILSAKDVIQSKIHRWMRKWKTSNFIVVTTIAVICCVHLYRIKVHDDLFVFSAKKCITIKTKSLDDENITLFFYKIWAALPNIINICSYGKLYKRIDMFKKGMHEVYFLTENIVDLQHHCDIVFVTDDGDLTIPQEMKQQYAKCSIYSCSEAHHSVFLNPSTNIVMLPFHIEPVGGLKEDLFEDIEPQDHRNISLVTLMSYFIRRHRISSIIIRTANASKFMPIFIDGGIFDDSHLTTCQINIFYPKPKSYPEILEFRNIWMRLLNDQRYWLTHVSRTTVGLNIFIVNIRDGYCWQKYLTHTLPHYIH